MIGPTGGLSPQAERALSTPSPGLWMPTIRAEDINLGSGYPYPAAIPVAAINEAWTRMLHKERYQPFQYLGSDGHGRWMAWLSQETESIRGDRDAIISTFGALQAVDLLTRVLIDDKTTVVVQGSTYMEALEIFRNYTPHIVAIAHRNGRFAIEDIEPLIQQRQAMGLPVRLIYWGADFQNPTGLEMSLEDRRRLVATANQGDAYILEDAAYRALAFTRALPSLKELDSHGRVIYVGSLSKTLAPGLRLGWALGPKLLISAMERLKKDLGNPLIEALVGHYLNTQAYAQHLHELRKQYAIRADWMLSCLGREMPSTVHWDIPRGGYFVWLRVNSPRSSDAIAHAAHQKGVVLLSGSHFSGAKGEDPHALRVSFSYESLERMAEGIRRLADLLRSGYDDSTQ